MALVEASRVSELQALDLRYHLYRPEGVLPILGKKRVVGAPPKEVMFGAFPKDSRLCVVRQYEKHNTNLAVLNICSCLTLSMNL